MKVRIVRGSTHRRDTNRGTKEGKQCRWTAASDVPAAAPLRAGGHFCVHHCELAGTPLKVQREDHCESGRWLPRRFER